MKNLRIVGFIVVLAAGTLLLSAQAPWAASGPPKTTSQKVVVRLPYLTEQIVTYRTYYLHRAAMTIRVATLMQNKGAQVSLFLDLEAVRLADTRKTLAAELFPGSSRIFEDYDEFVKAGGQVLVCSHCAQTGGVAEKWLRSGARIINESELADLFLAADKILNY